MEAWIIGAIILLGLALVFLEIFFIPGTTLFGVAGGVALVMGVSLVYVYYGSDWGHRLLLASVVAVVVAVLLGFRVIQSNKLAMKAQVEGRVNELQTHLQAGDTGTTITVLRPNGKAIFGGTKPKYIARVIILSAICRCALRTLQAIKFL
jgi:membrane-bound ClpP family serine protease